jgi:hypothetical protein
MKNFILGFLAGLLLLYGIAIAVILCTEGMPEDDCVELDLLDGCH